MPTSSCYRSGCLEKVTMEPVACGCYRVRRGRQFRKRKMLLVEKVIGDMRDAALAPLLHRLEHDHAVDTLDLEAGDLARRRLRAFSRRGIEVAIALPRDTALFDGAILLLDDTRAIVVRAVPTDWLVVEPRDAAAALELGYHAGNLHWRVRFEDTRLMVAMDKPVETYLARLAHLVEGGAVKCHETTLT